MKRARAACLACAPTSSNSRGSLPTGTLPLAGRHLPSDLWFHIVAFTDAYDLLSYSQCSKCALAAATSPGIIRQLITISPSDSLPRSALVMSFLSRHSRELLLAYINTIRKLQPPPNWRDVFFRYLQHAQISQRFPNEPALYSLADQWKIPRTLAAAWLNDIVALRELAQNGQLQPEARLPWRKHAAVTPLCLATTVECVQFLLQHRSDARADVRQPGSSTPLLVIHEVAARSSANALRVLLSAGASADINAFGNGRTCLHHALRLGSVNAAALVNACTPQTRLRREVAQRTQDTIDVLLQASANPCLRGDCQTISLGTVSMLPMSYFYICWRGFSSNQGSAQTMAIFKRLLSSTRITTSSSFQADFAYEWTLYRRILDESPTAFGASIDELRALLTVS